MRWLIHTNPGCPSVPFSTTTCTGPIPSCNVTSPAGPSGSSPSAASTCVVPTVGCPAIAISRSGVKMRTRLAHPGSSGGSTKVLSA